VQVHEIPAASVRGRTTAPARGGTASWTCERPPAGSRDTRGRQAEAGQIAVAQYSSSMRITIVHGYFLSDSGSAVYVRELAREMKRRGHEVTLVCQEQEPQHFGFIDCAWQLHSSNREAGIVYGEDRAGRGRDAGPGTREDSQGSPADTGRGPGGAGYCRLVRPHLGGRLLTYVAGPFPGFEARPLQDAEDEEVEAYLQANVTALETVFRRWPPRLVQANHAVMQPCIVRRALAPAAGKGAGEVYARTRTGETGGSSRTPYIVTVHGSALNFTVRKDERMGRFAEEGLGGARAVAALSRSSRDEVVSFLRTSGMDLSGKSHVVPPGVDTGLFGPQDAGKGETTGDVAEAAVAGVIGNGKSSRGSAGTLLFVGRLLWTKGPQYAVAALPLILARRPRTRLFIAGDGPMREPLLRLIDYLDAGDLAGAGRLLIQEPELRSGEGYGPVLPRMDGKETESYLEAATGRVRDSITFLGHQSHRRLAPLYSAADLVLSPSVFPEAFALVSAEAMASGALPLATYQTGLRDPLDAAKWLLGDEALTRLRPGRELTRELASTALHLLEAFPTGDAGFRGKLHRLAAREYSWARVAERYLELAGAL